jgi:sugar phosphate isomerase/epimerase
MSDKRGLSRREMLKSAALAGLGVAAMPLAARAQDKPASGGSAGGWQIGCYTRPFAAHDYKVALDAIAEAGFKYAGLMTTKNPPTSLVLSVQTTPEQAAEVGKACKDRGLIVPSCYGGEIPAGEGLEPATAGMRRLIDNCVAAGVKNLMMGGIGDQALYETYYKAIGAACDYAAEKGIGVSVKPHGGLNATGPELRKAVELVNNKNFGIWYDPGNIFYYSDMKLDPVDDAATVDGLVVGMSVKDYVHPKKVDVTPGDGKVDFTKVMARLKQGGFTSGPLIIETLTPGELPQLIAEAKRAREFVEKLVAQV